MAREAISERGLPSPEVRRQILKQAGMILHEARELMEQLDRHETAYPRTVCDQRRPIWFSLQHPYNRGVGAQVSSMPQNSDDPARQYQSDRTLVT